MLEVLKCRHSAFGRRRRRRSIWRSATCIARSSWTRTSPSRGRRWPTASRFARTRGMAPPAEAGAEADGRGARSALELDPTLADAHASLGRHRRSHAGDCRGGHPLARARRSSSIPGSPSRHKHRSRAVICFERHAEALAAMPTVGAARSAVDADPHRAWATRTTSRASTRSRSFYYRMAIELDPRFDGAHTDLARSLEALGRFDEARAAVRGRTAACRRRRRARPSGWRISRRRRGTTAEARRILDELTAARAHARRIRVGDRRAAREPRRRGRGIPLAGGGDRGEGDGTDPAPRPSTARSDPQRSAIPATRPPSRARERHGVMELHPSPARRASKRDRP